MRCRVSLHWPLGRVVASGTPLPREQCGSAAEPWASAPPYLPTWPPLQSKLGYNLGGVYLSRQPQSNRAQPAGGLKRYRSRALPPAAVMRSETTGSPCRPCLLSKGLGRKLLGNYQNHQAVTPPHPLCRAPRPRQPWEAAQPLLQLGSPESARWLQGGDAGGAPMVHLGQMHHRGCPAMQAPWLHGPWPPTRPQLHPVAALLGGDSTPPCHCLLSCCDRDNGAHPQKQL